MHRTLNITWLGYSKMITMSPIHVAWIRKELTQLLSLQN